MRKCINLIILAFVVFIPLQSLASKTYLASNIFKKMEKKVFRVKTALGKDCIEDKDHHSLSSSISYPLFNYSVSTNSYKKLWDEMGDNFIKIEKMRAEEIAERKKYFD